MDPSGGRHIKVHPNRPLVRTGSSLGRGGNIPFPRELGGTSESSTDQSTRDRRKSLKPYLQTSESTLTLPPSPKFAHHIESARAPSTIEEEDSVVMRLDSNGGTKFVSETEINHNEEGKHRKRKGQTTFEPTLSSTNFGDLPNTLQEFVTVPPTTRPDVYKHITGGVTSPVVYAKPPPVPSASHDNTSLDDITDPVIMEDDVHPLGATAGKYFDYTARLVASFWFQIAKEGEIGMHSKQPTRIEIKEEVERILMETELESKEKLYNEVRFIIQHFRQRRCSHFCREEKKFIKMVKKMGIKMSKSRQFCLCGLPKEYHTDYAIKHPSSKWTTRENTEVLYPWTFGNLDIPGHYNYLETPEGTRKYLRFDDIQTNPAHVWELFTKHWHLKPPNLVISVTGGEIKDLHQKTLLHQSFTNGILKAAVTTKAWIMTDGFHLGSSREISTIFQDHLQRSLWSEYDDHASIPLIGITPWGVVADRKNLSGINVGMDEAVYLYTSIEKYSQTALVPNALDPNHVIYLFPDDGTTGRYQNEPIIRSGLEKYIRKHTSLELVGAKDVKTPVVILVLGGDQFTLEKLADSTIEENQISVVIVNNSGPIASMLADIYQRLENEKPRSYSLGQSKEGRYGWSQEEEEILNQMFPKFEADGLLQRSKDKQYLNTIMHARHLIEVFGVNERDTKDLDKAILEATFGGTRDIAVQLNLTLAMDRCDIASSCIFVESRKTELRDVSETLQEVLIVAMETGRTKFVDLLLDQDYGGELDFKKLLTVQRLHRLHSSNLDQSCIMGKVLRSMCKRENDGSYLLAKDQLLPQIGRLIYQLMGDNYRLLYQEQEYRRVSNEQIPLKLTHQRKEEPVWHLLIWACMANQKEMAELFLFETSCKIGAALIAFEMFVELSKKAAILSETELSAELKEKGEYFQTLAMDILENLYAFDRDEAYATVTSVIPFRWSKYATPLHIADDTEAMRFMGHPCCQTLLNRIWYKYMDLDTKAWRLFPVFLFFPINLSGIVFDKKNLSYGTYKIDGKEKQKQSKISTVQTSNSMSRSRNVSESPNGYDNPAYDSSSKIHDSTDNVNIIEQDTEPDAQSESCCSNVWFRIKNYYTAPINKFILYFVTWLAFIGLFTYFLLTELRPITHVSQVTTSEWFIIVWVVCISLDEIKQLVFTKASGPLYTLSYQDIKQDTWYIHERMFFALRMHKLTNWVEDSWNKIDLMMILCFWASVICRFTLSAADFTIVRILFSITIIIFYYRILRISYIMKNIGPRVITIHAMMKDLTNFMLILGIFILSFGVAFQAILNPAQPVSADVLVDVLWRPYWQMFGELFIDDATTGMGRGSENQMTCTYNRTLSNEQPEMHPFCYHWMAPVLLGVFMLFTNILLLNLLIAIFSHSFEKIESEAQTIWRYHLYDLVHEYYHQVWLPPPLNVFCHLCNIGIWLSKWPRKWAYKAAKNRHAKALESMRQKGSLIARGPETQFLNNNLEKQVQAAMKQDCCYKFYLTEKEQEEISHFRQSEIMRNDDLEEKAYKRHLRSTAKEKDRNIRKMLKNQNDKLLEISCDIQDFRGQMKDSSGLTESPSIANRSYSEPSGGFDMSMKKKVDSMDDRMKSLDHKLDIIMRGLQQPGSHIPQKRISNLSDHSL